MRIFSSGCHSLFMIGIVFSITGNAQYINCGDFDNSASAVADHFRSKDTSRAYVELNNGTKIYGNNLAIISDNWPKGKIKIGDTSFRIKDTHGYFAGGVYYGRTSNTYAKRFLTGKINLYLANFRGEVDMTNFRGKTRTHSSTFCNYYAQKGDSTELVLLTSISHLKEIVRDCPTSLAMIDKPNSEIIKIMKEKPYYLNEVINIYNKGCQ